MSEVNVCWFGTQEKPLFGFVTKFRALWRHVICRSRWLPTVQESVYWSEILWQVVVLAFRNFEHGFSLYVKLYLARRFTVKMNTTQKSFLIFEP
jgi:hypothetical protein